MKILFHSYAYETGWTYQENLLPSACIKAGHDVLCVASEIGVDEHGRMGTVQTENDPLYLRRLPVLFKENIPLSYRLRRLKGFYEVLEEFMPDVIFFHALQTLNLSDAAKYKKKYPNIRVYFNTHTDYYTSGRNIISRIFLHRIFYRTLIQKYLYLADNIFYICINCGMFLWDEYKVPRERTELMAIGAQISGREQIIESRQSVLEELDLEGDSVLFVQAGKMDSNKCIIESITKFHNSSDGKFVFLLIGHIDDALYEEARSLIDSDVRIIYLGWKSGEELFRYLEAADFYIQPGKGSAIFENALCCSCAVIANYLVDYPPFIKGNGWLIKNIDELDGIYQYISKNKNLVQDMKKRSNDIAYELLDQTQLIKKIK